MLVVIGHSSAVVKVAGTADWAGRGEVRGGKRREGKWRKEGDGDDVRRLGKDAN